MAYLQFMIRAGLIFSLLVPWARAQAEDTELDDLAKLTVEVFQSGNTARLRDKLVPELPYVSILDYLPQVAPYFRHGPLHSMEVIDRSRPIIAQEGGVPKRVEKISYRLKFEDGFSSILAFAFDTTKAGEAKIRQINISGDPEAAAPPFSLRGQSLSHYLFLLSFLALPIFTLVTAIQCFRLRPRRRWLWMPCILLPWGKLTLNWTSGDFDFAFGEALLFGLSFKTNTFQEAVLGICTPIGALFFQLWRKGAEAPLNTKN